MRYIMCKAEKLRISNMKNFSLLESKHKEFNLLNEDFFKYYKTSSFLGKYLLRKQVNILSHSNNYVGYLWFSKLGTGNRAYCINSLYVEYDFINCDCSQLIRTFKRGSLLYYDCKLTSGNIRLLESLGFNKKVGTYELVKDSFNEETQIDLPDSICFSVFKKGRHEKIRCDLQNEIFHNSQREPLTLNDIYLDEIQDYYINDWCIFLQYKDDYIGYGQIIMNSNVPLIVNFGIKEEYRNKGLGDLFISYLTKIIFDAGYSEVKIKVDSNNEAAYRLYKKKGFKKIDEYYTWVMNI